MEKLTEEQKVKVRQLVSYELRCHIDDIKDDSNLANDFGCDSLDLISLVMELEKEFDILIPDSLVENVTTVEELFSCIEESISLSKQKQK